MKVKHTKDIARKFVKEMMNESYVSTYGNFNFDQPKFCVFGHDNDLIEATITINALETGYDHEPFDWTDCKFYFKNSTEYDLPNKISMYKAITGSLCKFAKTIEHLYLNEQHFSHLAESKDPVLKTYQNLTDIHDGLLTQAYNLAKEIRQMEQELPSIENVEPDKDLLSMLMARTFSNWCERQWKSDHNGFDGDLADPAKASFDLTYVHDFTDAIQLEENDLLKIQKQIKKGLGIR